MSSSVNDFSLELPPSGNAFYVLLCVTKLPFKAKSDVTRNMLIKDPKGDV